MKPVETVATHGLTAKALRVALLGLVHRANVSATPTRVDQRYTWFFSHSPSEGKVYTCRHCEEQIDMKALGGRYGAPLVWSTDHACTQAFENLRLALLRYVDATPAQLNELTVDVLNALVDTIDEDEVERRFGSECRTLAVRLAVAAHDERSST